LLGTIFFGGLWWTIRKGISSKQPAALFFFSLLLRTVLHWLVSILSRMAIGAECWLAWLDLSWRASW
jgi:F1F0 ATPase subunit 2